MHRARAAALSVGVAPTPHAADKAGAFARPAPTLTGMGILQRLARLDSRMLRHLRQPEESAEAYLRRISAAGGPGGHATAAEVGAALREYFQELDRRQS